MGDVPFREVYIHGLVRDERGEKYSKTRGNVVDPLDLINRFGADALRFTLAALTMPGSDLKLSEARTEGYRHFVNKIWNASRFTLMNLSDFRIDEISPHNVDEYSLPDRWVRGKVNQAIREVKRSLGDYKFNEASHTLYQFVWHEFCDWYLELIKPDLYQSEEVKRKNLTQDTLFIVLDATLRMLHPFMPFVTEEISQHLHEGKGNGTIMKADYPEPDPRFDDEQVQDEMGLVIEIITALRNIRGEMNIPPGEQITAFLKTKEEGNGKRILRNQDYIQNLAKVQELRIGGNIEKPQSCAFAVVRGVEIFVPMDRSRMEEEVKRLKKEKLKIGKEILLTEKKLSNEQFMTHAPPEVIEEVRDKALEYRRRCDTLEENLKKLTETLR
jgi:valyl-tRNA synthetase